MNKKHLLFIFVLISMVSVLFADENLDKQLENGVFNIKDWNLAFIRESNPSLMLARLYQSYNRVFVKKHGRNKDLEQFIKEKMPLESQKALWENLLWQNNFNEYLSECIANEITSEEYDDAHYLADLDFILNPANAENPEKILEYADRAMKYKDNFRFTGVVHNAAKRAKIEYRVIETDYFDYLLKKDVNMIDDIKFKARWVVNNDGTVFNKMDLRVKERLKRLLFRTVNKTLFANPSLEPLNVPVFPGAAGYITMFFNTDCQFCKNEIEYLSKKRFAQKKQILLVNTLYKDFQKSKDDTRKLIEEYSVEFPTFIDKDNSIAEKLGFSGLPVFLYVPPQGNDAILFEVKIPGNIIEKLNWLAGE